MANEFLGGVAQMRLHRRGNFHDAPLGRNHTDDIGEVLKNRLIARLHCGKGFLGDAALEAFLPQEQPPLSGFVTKPCSKAYRKEKERNAPDEGRPKP